LARVLVHEIAAEKDFRHFWVRGMYLDWGCPCAQVNGNTLAKEGAGHWEESECLLKRRLHPTLLKVYASGPGNPPHWERRMISTLRNLLVRATLPADSPVAAPSALLVFAHPDDEVIGLGARLTRYRSAVIVHVTDGAPRNHDEIRSHGFSRWEDYSACRENELQKALELAGLGSVQRISFQIPDQEASLHLAGLTRELHTLLMLLSPEVVFTHPYEGGHPDHDACAFAAGRAVARARANGRLSPTLVEASFYHLGSEGIETGSFLRHREKTEEIVRPLCPRERKHKRDLLECFASQRETLRYFEPEKECFRIAPKYDFREPPHPGRVFYEGYQWGMTARRFCELASAADPVEAAACR
jgi:N-acetylglucosamine malate deacetylase 2